MFSKLQKTLVAESYFLSCDSDNHCSTYVEVETAPDFTR